MINNLEGKAFTDAPYFNVDFIKANKIKSITGHYSRKKDGDMIRETNDFYQYTFDTLGQLISTLGTKSENNRIDTTFNYYEYTPAGKLKMHRKTEAGGVTSFHYEYDSLNRLIYLEHRRDILDSLGRITQSILVNHESMKYVSYDGGFRKITYNSYNLPYLEETETKDKDGYVLEQTQRMRMASSEYKKKYFYNEKGLLARISMHYNATEIPYEEWLFKYDAYGNVMEKHLFKNEKFIRDLQIIYDTKTQLLGSTIQREENANYMMILRFQNYEYYTTPKTEDKQLR